MKYKLIVVIGMIMVIGLLIFNFINNSKAAVPKLINFQGRLTDNSGNPITGSKTLTFKIFDAQTGGNKIWEGQYTVNLEQGVFSIQLGADPSPFSSSVDFNKDYWLEISMGTTTWPRQRITSVGYAMQIGNVFL